MEYFPSTGLMECLVCGDSYTLNAIWEHTGCDCHDEYGRMTCHCGNDIDFVLNLDFKDNKEKLIADLLARNPRHLYSFHKTVEVLGEIKLTADKEGVKLEVISDEKDCLKESDKVHECVVCYENTRKTTKCNHSVCRGCYNRVDLCPYCRGDISSKEEVIIRSEMEQKIALRF
jgi:hypothetical protein